MNIPDCYEPDVMLAAQALQQAVHQLRLPCCQCCGLPIVTEKYLDLAPFGLSGLSCQTCFEKHSHYTDLWEEDL